MDTTEKKTLLILQLLLMAPLAGVGIDLFVPSLPSITQELATNANTTKFTIVLYLIGYAIGQPIFGTLSDAWGRKKPLLVGLALYTLLSLSIAFSPDIKTMLFLRLLQGIAVAAPGVLSKTILTDVFLGERLTKLATSMTITWAIGPIIAPVLGGYLETFLGWQSNFYFLALYGGALFCLTLFFLQETSVSRISLNIPHLLQIYKEALTQKVFLGALTCISIVYSMIVVFNVAGPFLIQTVLHYSPIAYGHFALFMGLGFFLGSLGNRLLIRRYSVSRILPVSIFYGCTVAALMLMSTLLFGLHLFTLIFFPFLLLITSGSVFPNCMAKCLSLFPKNAGTASAIMGSLFIIGTSIITAIASFLETETLIPISLCYALLMAICLITYLSTLKGKI